MEKKTVLVAMSGGVDSSVAAALLVEQGHTVIGVTMKTFCYQEAEATYRTCARWGELLSNVGKLPALPWTEAASGFAAAWLAYSGIESLGQLAPALREPRRKVIRTTVVLVTLQGLSHEQAAVVLACSPGTVAWRIHEARRRLHDALQPPPREGDTARSEDSGLFCLTPAFGG